MSYKLYLDDVRDAPKTDSTTHPWVVARTVQEAISIINLKGMPFFISFDNDLGTEDKLEGYDFAKWLGEKLLDKDLELPPTFNFYVHSANPCAAENIRKYMDNLLRYLRR